MQRIRTAWELGKISWSVLRADRTLAWFPVISAIASLVVLGVFAGLIAAMGVDSSSGTEGLEGIGYVLIGVGYVALAFVGTYFLAALVFAANARLDGRPTSLGEAFGQANSHLHVILPWALLTGVVSIVISTLESRGGFVSDLVGRMLGAAWSVLTFLTVPVLVLENVGPVTALKRSGSILKQTWGENLTAQFGFGFRGMLASLPGALVLGLGIASGSVVLAVALGIVGAAWIVLVSVVMSALTGIYRTALYRYSVDGQAPPAFANADLGGAFTTRRRGGRGII
jgi:hypothetical protein